MDLQGFKIFEKTEWESVKKRMKNYNSYFEVCVGTNEEVMYENGNELLNKIKVKNISEDEYKVIRRVIGTEFGFDNVFERDAWYDEDEEMT